MTIYDFIEALNENNITVFTLFDCNSEDVVFMATDESDNTCELSRDDLLFSEYADYEICSIDMWFEKDKDRIHIELNIEIEEEEF